MTPLSVARPSAVGTEAEALCCESRRRNSQQHRDTNDSTMANAATNWQEGAAGLPLPLLPPGNKPPRLPVRHEASSCVGGGQINCGDVRESLNASAVAAPAALSEDDDELRYLELAKLMLSPEGLPLKKVTLEGFAIPVSLRLLDRQQLSLTWLENDEHGFELGGLTVFGRGLGEDADRTTRETDDELQPSARDNVALAGQSSKSSKSTTSNSARQGECDGRERSDSNHLVLSWASGSEVVFQTSSRDQRDSLEHCLELLVADIRRLQVNNNNNDGSNNSNQQYPRPRTVGFRDTGPGSTDNSAVMSSDGEGRFDRQAGAGRAGDVIPGPLESAAEHEELALSPGFEDTVLEDDLGNSTDTSPMLPRGIPRFRSANDAHMRRRTLALRTPDGREGSFAARSSHRPLGSFGGEGGAVRRGVSMGPRDFNFNTCKDLSPEREWHDRRAEDTMAKLLAGYDRAKDECRAATWRVGVSSSWFCVRSWASCCSCHVQRSRRKTYCYAITFV